MVENKHRKMRFRKRLLKKRPEQINEVIPTGEENDEEMNVKAKKLMNLISKKIPSNVITTITTKHSIRL